MGRGKLYVLLLKILLHISRCVLANFEDETAKLKKNADYIKSSMDLDVDPCEDFYLYACGSWGTNFKAPSDKQIWNNFNILDRNALFRAIVILSDKASRKDSKGLSMEKKYFKACMNTKKSATDGLKFMKRIVKKNGGLLLENDNFPKINILWQDVAKLYATEFGESAFFDIFYNDNILQFRPPRKSGAHLTKFAEEESIIEYLADDLFKYHLTAKQMKLLTEDSLNSFRLDLVSFIKSLNKIVFDTNNNRLEVITIKELQDKYDDWSYGNDNEMINWLDFFKSLLKNNKVKMNFSDSIKIGININYVEKLCFLLQRSSVGTIVNYIHYIFTMDYSTQIFWKPDMDETTTDTYKSSWCIQNMPIEKHFLAKVFEHVLTESNTNFVTDMFKILCLIFRILFQRSLSDVIPLETGIDKIDNMTMEIVNKYYSDPEKMHIEISYDFKVTDLALQNLINFKRAQTNYKLEQYKIHHNEIRRDKRAIAVNAAYREHINTVHVMSGLLFHSLFNVKGPIAMMYGSLGAIIGHEMSHAFDMDFYHYLIGKTSFKSSPNALEYLKRAQCLAEQFEKHEVDGVTSFNENFADMNGLKIAFQAFRRIIDKDPTKDKKLPDLEDWSANKLFFISFASNFCQNVIEEYEDGHEYAPVNLRVNVGVSNIPGFKETFGCKPDSPMMKLKHNCYIDVKNLQI